MDGSNPGQNPGQNSDVAPSRKRWIITFIVVVALAIEVGGLIYGWPILRTAQYRVAADEYAHATPVAAIPMDNHTNHTEWKFDHSLSSGTTVHIQARDFMDVVKVNYGDGPHDLYRYVDYSSPIALKVAGDVLYVYWGEALIHSDRWLLAYDLASRREIYRRRVDPRDIDGTR